MRNGAALAARAEAQVAQDAAPYDGALEKSLVKPGDLVSEGQVLARMDEREISLELSVFVGLIITNCLVLGRTEGFAMQNPPWISFIDGVGNDAEELSRQLERHQVEWHWTRGHAGNRWNERADRIINGLSGAIAGG